MKRKRLMTQELGFSLIEMLVVVLILGTLVALAYPNYRNYILRTHRTDARNALQAVVQRMNQIYTVSHSYRCKVAEFDGNCPFGQEITDETLNEWGYAYVPAHDVRFNLSFLEIKIDSYSVQAVPTLLQSRDICATFQINQSNVKTAAGETSSRARKSILCWTK